MILDTRALLAVAAGNPKLEPILREAAEVAAPVIAVAEFHYARRHSHLRARPSSTAYRF